MHSRVFSIVNSQEDAIDTKDLSNLDAEELAYLGIDYIVREDTEEEFRNSINWLANYYGLNITFKRLKKTGKLIAIVDKAELFKSIEQKIEARVPMIEEALSKRDMWEVAYHAYNQKGFLFYIYEESGIINEVDLYSLYRDSVTLGDKLYIVDTYDYHY